MQHDLELTAPQVEECVGVLHCRAIAAGQLEREEETHDLMEKPELLNE